MVEELKYAKIQVFGVEDEPTSLEADESEDEDEDEDEEDDDEEDEEEEEDGWPN